MVVSEAVHHFRTALDCVVRELAWIDSGGDPCIADISHGFPIVNNARQWNAPSVVAAIDGVSVSHVEIIKRFQPYRSWGGSIGEIHPLRVLQALVDDDRHQAPRLAYRQAAAALPPAAFRCTDCRLDRRRLGRKRILLGVESITQELTPGTELVRVPLIITGANPSVDLDICGMTYIAVGPGLSVVQSLGSIMEFVRQVLRAFEPEFSRPRAARKWHERPGQVDALPRPAVISLTRIVRGVDPHAPMPLGGGAGLGPPLRTKTAGVDLVQRRLDAADQGRGAIDAGGEPRDEDYEPLDVDAAQSEPPVALVGGR